MEFTFAFLKFFFWSIYLIAPILVFLCGTVILFGQIVTHIEKWNKFDGFYWSLITATTVGYGDIRPIKKISKIFSILIAFVGMIFTGIMIAIALNSVTLTFEKHVDKSSIEEIRDKFEKNEN